MSGQTFNNPAYQCVSCKIKEKNTGKYPLKPIACFNVNNGSLSINTGEILPFYRNIEKLGSDHYVVDDNAAEGKSCQRTGDIALNKMKCTFAIYNGGRYKQTNHPYKTKTFDCFEVNNSSNKRAESKLIKDFLRQQKFNFLSSEDRSFAFRSRIEAFEKFGEDADVLGEYKLVLEKVDYLQCIADGDKMEWKKMDPYPRVCEVDFALTSPYILQKTPAGNIQKSQTDLNLYTNINGDQIFAGENSYLKDVLSVNDFTYQANPDTEKALENFIKTYSKLAVNAAKSSLGNNVKKVPGKEIYFVDGDITLTKGQIQKPFTIVNTKGTTTIKGDVEHNMMLLTQGEIIFDGAESCHTAQKLKGIFYADKFRTTNTSRNTDLNNSERCTGGNLHIKGIAIAKQGETLLQVSKARRSELNKWFGCSSTSEQCIKERQGYVMNGASLLIEYAPSIFEKKTMPPGAEDFMKAFKISRAHGAAPTKLSFLQGKLTVPVR